MGDSMALKLIPTVLAAFGADYHIKGITLVGCPLIAFAMSFPADGSKETCDTYRTQAVAAVIAAKPDLLIVTNNYGATIKNTAGGSNLDAWQQAVTSTIGSLKGHAGKILLVSPPPGGADPAACYTKVSTPSDCTAKISAPWNDGFQAEKGAASLIGVSYLDTHLWYCSTDNYCPVFSGTTPMRIDGIHTSAEYAAVIAPAFKAAVSQYL
jgi:hypothetical protein